MLIRVKHSKNEESDLVLREQFFNSRWLMHGTFCLSCEQPGIKPAPRTVLSTTLTGKPNTQMSKCHLDLVMKPFSCTEWWPSISQWSKFHFQIFLFSSRFILFQYTDARLCAKVRDLKLTINKMRSPQTLDLPAARLRNSFVKGNC